MLDTHMVFFFIYKIVNWSLNSRFISRGFFNNYSLQAEQKTAFQSGNLSQQHNARIGKYVG